MVKKKLTLFERYRRLKRIIRYLRKRGTLFRSKPPVRELITIPQKPRKKKVWRPWRKIRYLAKKGTLLRKKKTAVTQLPLPVFYKKRSKYDLYLAYRRIRFLINTGRLFSKKSPEHQVKKKKRRIIRRIRYLLYRRSLFKIDTNPIRHFWKDYFKTLSEPDYLKIIINSTALFLLAYLIVFTILNFTSSFAALTFDINSTIYYYNIIFHIRSKDWTIDAIKMVYSAGPFICLIFSLITLVLYLNVSQETWFIRLLFFWIFCHSIIHFFGEMLIGTLLMKGFGLSIVYIFLVEYKKLLIILISVFFLMLSGLTLTKMAILSGNTYFNMVTKKNRSYFLHSQIFIPYILGCVIIFFIKMPDITEFDLFVNLTMFFVILPILIRGRSMKDLYFDPETRKIRIRWIFLFATIFVLVIYRILFGFGVSIGSQENLLP